MASDWSPPQNWEKRPFVVLGGGVLGRRIAACFVAAGHHVIIRDPSEKSRSDALAYIKENIKVYTNLTSHEAGTYEATEDFETAVKDAWLIIEAVPEVLKIKEETFEQLEKHAPKDCILATNSSSYKSSDIIGKVSKEATKRVCNIHFMMPPEAVIVELMTCGNTEPGVFPFLEERCKEAGLHPMTALRESTGFIFNRIWAAIKREVLSVMEEGVATPETIDAMWIEQYCSRKIGPCTMMDSIGLDTVQHIEQHYIDERKLPTKHLDWLKSNFIESGKLGLKTPDKGGLYAPPPKGTLTKIISLNLGVNEPMKGKTMDEILHSGSILSMIAENPNNPVEIVSGLYMPDGIDISKSTKRMYWTCMGNPSKNDGLLQSANLDGSDVQTIVSPGKVHTPKQLHIDQTTDKLYFCDREGLRVMRCNTDGSELEELYKTGDWEKEPEKVKDQRNWCVGITTSQKLKKFFWTQKGSPKGGQGRIFCAPLEMPKGETAATRSDVELVLDNLPECIDLEFDDEAGALYWTDRGELPLGNTLNRKQIVGEAPKEEDAIGGREILAQGFGEGIGLKIDHEKRCIYAGDLAGRLWRCHMDFGMKDKIYEGPTHAYTGLTYHRL